MILLADDDPMFLEHTEQVLARQEPVYFARDAQSARQLLGAIGAEFTVALVNAELPQGTGLDLIREIRGMAPDLPVIAIGGGDNARQAGAAEIIRKPVTREWQGVIDRVRRQAAAGGR